KMLAPSTTFRLCSRRWNQRMGGAVGSAVEIDGTPAATFATAVSLVAILVVPDPRVDERVDHVDREIDQNVGRRRYEHNALHHGVTAPEDRRDDEAAAPRDVEDDLDHDGAADEDRHRDTDDGHDRDERVPEGVDIGDDPVRQALGARRPDVVLLEYL